MTEKALREAMNAVLPGAGNPSISVEVRRILREAPTPVDPENHAFVSIVRDAYYSVPGPHLDAIGFRLNHD